MSTRQFVSFAGVFVVGLVVGAGAMFAVTRPPSSKPATNLDTSITGRGAYTAYDVGLQMTFRGD